MSKERQKRAFFLLVNFNTGIAGAAIGEYGTRGSETVCVFVENDRALILDELPDKI